MTHDCYSSWCRRVTVRSSPPWTTMWHSTSNKQTNKIPNTCLCLMRKSSVQRNHCCFQLREKHTHTHTQTRNQFILPSEPIEARIIRQWRMLVVSKSVETDLWLPPYHPRGVYQAQNGRTDKALSKAKKQNCRCEIKAGSIHSTKCLEEGAAQREKSRPVCQVPGGLSWAHNSTSPGANCQIKNHLEGEAAMPSQAGQNAGGTKQAEELHGIQHLHKYHFCCGIISHDQKHSSLPSEF